MEYPSQGGFSEGGRRLSLSWLHDRSRPERSCFVPYFKHALETENFKIAIALDRDILKMGPLKIRTYCAAARL